MKRGRILLAIALSVFPIGANGASDSPEFCYSKFAPSVKPEFKHGFTRQLTWLLDLAIDEYNGGSNVIDIPIAQDGSLYIASTCTYVLSLLERLDEGITFAAISSTEYAKRVDVAGQNGRVIRAERN